MMNKMLRAVIVTVIFSVATFNVIKCDNAKCTEKVMEENSRKTIEMTVDYEALLKEKSIVKTFKKGDNNAPFDSNFTFSYNKNQAQIKVKCCVAAPEKDLEKFYRTYYPLILEIVNQGPFNKKCKKINILNPHADIIITPFVDKQNVPKACLDTTLPSTTLSNHKKYFVKGSNIVVKANYFPTLSECKDEYIKNKGTYDWEIQPYSQIKWNFKKKIINYYTGPIMYSNPSGFRIMAIMTLEIGKDDVDTVTIALFTLAGPFSNKINYKVEVAIPSDRSQPLQTIKNNSPVSFKIKKHSIKDNVLKIKMQIKELK